MRINRALHFLSVGLVLALILAGCSLRPNPTERAVVMLNDPPIETPSAKLDRSDWPVIVAFGDSLTFGYGVPGEQNYPSQLQAALDRMGYRYRVVNEGISGETTADGLARVKSVLAHKPAIVIVEFGANDGLRHGDLDRMKKDLKSIVTQLQAERVQVVLAGMQVPPAYGQDYTRKFAAVFPAVAKECNVPLIPFFLEGVGGRPVLNLPDGIHPTARGYAYVKQNVWTVLQPLLKR